MKKAKIKPGIGRLLRQPLSHGAKLVPLEGIEVELSAYWRRRLRSGDAVLVVQPEKAPRKKAEE